MVNFLLLFFVTEIVISRDQDIVRNLNCTNYVQSKYKKGWTKMCVRLGDISGLLPEPTKIQLSKIQFSKKNFHYVSNDNIKKEDIKSQYSHKKVVTEQFVELIVNYDKDGKHSDIMISINQINTIESALKHFIDTCLTFEIRNRPNFLAFPSDKFFTDAIHQYKINTEIKNLQMKFSDNTLKQLARNSDYFFAHNDWVPNLALLYKNNMCVLIQDISPVTDIVNREHFNNTRPNLSEILMLANFLGQIFEKNPDQNVTLKDAPLEQLSLSIIENNIRESGKCTLSWKLTSDAKLPLYGTWVRCDVDNGMLEIIEQMPDVIKKSIDENTTKLNRPDDEGKIIISKIPPTGCTLTAYAITANGKTWYRRQIKIDPNKMRTIASEIYRKWISFDGQYTIIARLISISGIDTIDLDKIDFDKLKDKIVTIEKSENKKLVEVKFNDLSKIDQEYILQQIKTQK
jgi:hypothetical protein